MKFGKRLRIQIEETLPEWRDKFLSYKELKKRVKLIDPKVGERESKRPRLASAGDGAEAGEKEVNTMTSEEIEFIRLLEDELEKFNSFFVNQEEEYIIKLKLLQDRLAAAKESNEEMEVWKEIVDFHGEMVLLENYSAFNYTGLVKILKKYEKRTGALIRLPFIQKVLQQPFFTTDLLYKLVKECERLLDSLFPINEPALPAEAVADDEGCTTATTKKEDLLEGPKELAEIEYIESLYMKRTLSALRTLKDMRRESSTVSMFSLPPLQINELEETWKKIPLLEQAAK